MQPPSAEPASRISDVSAQAKKFETIERDVNKETSLVYAKNSLVLEKVILDRALSKVQKRSFMRKNVQ